MNACGKLPPMRGKKSDCNDTFFVVLFDGGAYMYFDCSLLFMGHACSVTAHL